MYEKAQAICSLAHRPDLANELEFKLGHPGKDKITSLFAQMEDNFTEEEEILGFFMTYLDRFSLPPLDDAAKQIASGLYAFYTKKIDSKQALHEKTQLRSDLVSKCKNLGLELENGINSEKSPSNLKVDESQQSTAALPTIPQNPVPSNLIEGVKNEGQE